MKRLAAILTLVTLCCSCARADSIRPAYPYVTASVDGRYYFKMVPDPKHNLEWDTHGSGTMFEVSADGQDKPLWNISGWYAYATYVSYDGKYLVRMGNWPPGEPSGKHLAIAFYENGKLVKSYSTVEILKNPANAPKSVSHYQFLKETIGFKSYDYNFRIKTVENIEYTFDVTSGRIVSEKPVSEVQPSSLGFIRMLSIILYGSA